MIAALIQSMRPKQWTKNLLAFAGLIFSRQLFVPSSVAKCIGAFICLCLVSSAQYLFNDVLDRESDRKHPLKSQRPIASGKISTSLALGVGALLCVLGLISAFLLDYVFFGVILVYTLLAILYTLLFKHTVILDVLSIAIGFVLRAVAGAVVIHVLISPWLLACTVFLALFLILCKRRHELVLLGDDAAIHRKSLEEYNPVLLDQMVSVATASTVVCYALYTLDTQTVAKFGTTRLIYTLPFVLFGILRYLYLVYQKEQGGHPERVLLTDTSLIVNLILWAATVGWIVYG